jgi:phosphoribosylformylglycinamidine synthase
MTHTFTIQIRRKPGLSDPEGATTAKALEDLGFGGVERVSFGRTITIEMDSDSEEVAHAAVEQMCRKLLANPVMETYRIEATS